LSLIRIARHIAANAAGPDSKFPFSLAWKRASIVSASIGQADACARVTSTNSIAAPVKPPYHRDFLVAQKTGPIVPDKQPVHPHDMGHHGRSHHGHLKNTQDPRLYNRLKNVHLRAPTKQSGMTWMSAKQTQ